MTLEIKPTNESELVVTEGAENSAASIPPAPKRDLYKRTIDRILVKLANSVEADCHHPYLEDNEVGAHDLSLDNSGNLLAVAIDLKASFKENAYIPCPQNLLTITPDGEFDLEPKAKFTGCAVMIGHRQLRQIARDRQGKHEIFITTDYATGAFLLEETGSPAVVAVRTCNMAKVHAILKSLFPKANIVVCLNFETNKHRMRKKTVAEIRSSGGVAIVPRFTLKERFNGLISFNDLAMFHQNRDRVIEIILNLIQYGQEHHEQTAEKAPGTSAKASVAAKNPAKSPKSASAKTSKTATAHKSKPRKSSACRQEVNI